MFDKYISDVYLEEMKTIYQRLEPETQEKLPSGVRNILDSQTIQELKDKLGVPGG